MKVVVVRSAVELGGSGNGMEVVEWDGWSIGWRWLTSRKRHWERGGCGGRDRKWDGGGWVGGNLQVETPNGVCVSLSEASLEPVPMDSVPGSLPKPTTTSSREITPTYQGSLLPSPLPQLLHAAPQPPQRRGSHAGTCQLFLEITPRREPYFLTQMISFLPHHELISIPKHARVDRCSAGPNHGSRFLLARSFYRPSNQAGPS